MSGEVLIVDFRFGEKYYVTEFVKPNTFEIAKVCEEKLRGRDLDETLKNILKFIRDEFVYPFDYLGNPSTNGLLLRHRKMYGKWYFKSYVNYMWDFPSETLIKRCGVCIDTSNLCCSLLRHFNFNAYVELGKVYKMPENQFLGYHAWVTVNHRDAWWVIETTIHRRGVVNIVKRDDAYSGRFGVRYECFVRYNEKDVEYVKPFNEVIVLISEMKALSKVKLRKMEKNKQKFIWSRYEESSKILVGELPWRIE